MALPPIHVVDFEGHPRYGVVEYGVATVADGAIVATATRRCRALAEIPLADVRVHGLAAAELRDLPPFADDFDRFVGWRRSGVLAAHNAWVEHRLLKHTWAFPPFVPAWGEAGEVADWAPWLCTLRLARARWPSLPAHGVQDLVSAFGLDQALEELAAVHCPAGRDRPHCALYDALAAALVLQTALEDLDGDDPACLPALLHPETAFDASPQQGELF